MKKIVTLFGTLVLVLCLCCGLAACGEGGNGAVETESVTLDKKALALEVGGEATLTVTVTPENATEKTVTWVSNKPEIAKVENGKVTALAEGAATITASAGGKSATCAVTVTAAASAGEVSAEEWKAIFDGIKSFTITGGAFIRVDGSKYELNYSEGIKQIEVKEGEEYFEYFYMDSKWSRGRGDADVYENQAAPNGQIPLLISSPFEEFSFEDGIYTRSSVSAVLGGENATFQNIKITIVDKQVTKISYELVTDMDQEPTLYEITEINTTAIELPTEFVIL